jgi:hypothetical protein
MKFAHPDVLDGGLSAIKNAALKLLLVSNFSATDTYAAVVANKVAEVAVTAADFTLATSGLTRTLTSAVKSGVTTTGNTQQYEGNTASGGTLLTLIDATKAWAANVHTNRAVTIISGTGAGQTGRIASNTTTALTIDAAWAVAPDATSAYRVSDNLHFAFTDGVSKVLYVTDEASNQPITTGNSVDFPALVYTSGQPI